MKFGIVPHRLDALYGEDLRPVLELLKLADRRGIDAVNVPAHVLMGDQKLDDYPYADPETRPMIFTERTPFPDPLVFLSAIAAVTQRIRLSTNVLLSPLHTAPHLARQLATLDCLSGGRVEIAVGVGWQKLEYDASGIPWEGRFGRMTEIALACREMWAKAPASFHGKHINFDGVYILPAPVQKGGIPQWFGVAPTDRNIERIASAADGWAPLKVPLDVVAATATRIKARMGELGRDPGKFRMRLHLDPVFIDGKPNLDATLARTPKLIEAGATDVDIFVAAFCHKPEDFEPFIDRYASLRSEYRS
jgi:probable F420-dependent oxidoreductase